MLFDPSGQILSQAYYGQAGQPGSLTTYYVDRNTLVDNLSGLAANGSWAIDLMNGVGGYSSTGQILSALHTDGHGGTLLSLGGAGSLDIAGLAPNQMSAANFRIG